MNDTTNPRKPDGKKVVIHIDREKFKVDERELTGTELRAVPEPDIGPEREFWLDVKGGLDQQIGDDQAVKLRNGMHFFTVPGNINPG